MKAIPILADDQRVIDVAERLAELNRQHSEAEVRLRELRSSAAERASFAQRAEDLANGIEHPAEVEPLEQRIAAAVERVELLSAAVGAQTRRLHETRETVVRELIGDQLAPYAKMIGDVAAKVESLCKALAAHDEFCNALAAAGLPVTHAIPAGGNWKKPQILRYFGRSTNEQNSLAQEFTDVLAECGYAKLPGKVAARVA